MPKMTHWNSPDAIDVAVHKVAVYQAQGWVVADGDAAAAVPAGVGMTRAAADSGEARKPAKKAAAKKTTAKKK